MIFHKTSKILFVTAILSAMTTFANATPSLALKQKMAKIGNVKEVKETESKGIYAWYLEKNGKTLVLYTTPDEKYFIKGAIYNVSDKKIISDKYALESLNFASPQFKNKILKPSSTYTAQQPSADLKLTRSEQEAFSKGYLNLKWNKGDIPAALKLVDSLAGAKEGNAAPQDTLYIIYDPRCPWCHRTFEATRDFVKKGYSIKWIPTLALGHVSDSALSLAAAPIQNPKLLTASFNKEEAAKAIRATNQNKKDIETNLQFLFAYFNKVKKDQNPSVPIGLFLDKTTGKVTDLQGLQERPTLELLFGPSN